MAVNIFCLKPFSEHPSKESGNTMETVNEETEELANIASQEALTPLDALVLRIDNNERIPTDELISIINQIVKS